MSANNKRKEDLVDLGGRKLSILKVIIDDYIMTGQPVGSRTVSKKPSIMVSSATVRNEMADLEELGYLLQPHTSAGRIPSDIGYRLYVDMIPREECLDDEDKKAITSLLFAKKCELEDLVRESLKIISEMTGLVAIISLPLFKKSRLQNMKLIKVTDSKILMILVSDTGVVKNISLPIAGPSQEDLDFVSEAMLSKLKNIQIETIGIKQIYQLKESVPGYESFIDYLIPQLRALLKDIGEYEIYVEGKDKVLDMPDFTDISKARAFVELLSDRALLFELLKHTGKDIEVRIGDENELDEFKNFSVVSAPYKFAGAEAGRLAVLGPTRMNYDRVLNTVSFATATLNHLFSGIVL